MRHNRTLSSSVERGRARARAGFGPARWAALAILMAASVVAGGAAAGDAAAPRARLSTVTATTGALGTSVLIEASEPVAYATTRPDPLTVLVDLRNATTAGAVNHLASAPIGGVAAVTLEDARASDGVPVARVRLLLTAPGVPEVRSERNTIQVNVAPEAARALASQPAAATPPGAAEPDPQGAVRIEAISTSAAGPVEVTLKGSGPLAPTSSELTREKPYRLVLDFNGVTTAVAAATPINKGPIQRIRVATHSAKPLVTRVVFDLAGPVTFRLEPAGNDLKVVLGDAGGETVALPAAKAPAPKAAPPVAKASATKAPAPAAPAAAPKPRAARPPATKPAQAAAEKPAAEKSTEKAIESPAPPPPPKPAPAATPAMPPVTAAPGDAGRVDWPADGRPSGTAGTRSAWTSRERTSGRSCASSPWTPV